MSTNYGYIRVSSYDQNEGRQLIAMQQMGISDMQISNRAKILSARSTKNCCAN